MRNNREAVNPRRNQRLRWWHASCQQPPVARPRCVGWLPPEDSADEMTLWAKNKRKLSCWSSKEITVTTKRDYSTLILSQEIKTGWANKSTGNSISRDPSINDHDHMVLCVRRERNFNINQHWNRAPLTWNGRLSRREKLYPFPLLVKPPLLDIWSFEEVPHGPAWNNQNILHLIIKQQWSDQNRRKEKTEVNSGSRNSRY